MMKKILILAANPKNTPSLRLDEEIREIDHGLNRAPKRDEFVLEQKLAARPVDVRRAMLDCKPNIVHFCGHGSGEEGIAFEDESGQAKLINSDTLADFFELFADKVECIVLNACYSETQAEAIAKHIPFVIGMTRAIGDRAAIEFAVAFYDALGAGEQIEFAYKLACNAIQWAGLPEHLTPVLKKRLPNLAQGKELTGASETNPEDMISVTPDYGILSFSPIGVPRYHRCSHCGYGYKLKHTLKSSLARMGQNTITCPKCGNIDELDLGVFGWLGSS